jgi:hypothetical protein
MRDPVLIEQLARAAWEWILTHPHHDHRMLSNQRFHFLDAAFAEPAKLLSNGWVNARFR